MKYIDCSNVKMTIFAVREQKMFVNYKVQMNRRNLILAVGVSLAVIFIALLGTQYFYFLRLNEIHKSQTKQLV